MTASLWNRQPIPDTCEDYDSAKFIIQLNFANKVKIMISSNSQVLLDFCFGPPGESDGNCCFIELVTIFLIQLTRPFLAIGMMILVQQILESNLRAWLRLGGEIQ